jgi:hypothetical protein
MMIGRTDEQQNPPKSPTYNMPQLCHDCNVRSLIGRNPWSPVRHIASISKRIVILINNINLLLMTYTLVRVFIRTEINFFSRQFFLDRATSASFILWAVSK